VVALLGQMKTHSRKPKAKALGWIGKDHAAVAMMAFDGVAGGVIEYRKVMGEADGRPFVVEVAFGVREDAKSRAVIRSGINWTPSLSAIHWRLHRY